MRVPREVWWIAGLTLVMFVIYLALGGEQSASEDEPRFVRTTYSSGPDGLRALYLTLQELDCDARRWRLPLRATALPDSGTLVIVDPMPLAASEWEELHDWVGRGNRVLLAGLEALPEVRWHSERRIALGSSQTTSARPIQPTYLTQGVESLSVRSPYRIPLEPSKESEEEDDEEVCDMCSGVGRPPRAFHESLARAAPMFADDEGIIAAHARVGQGSAVLLCSPWSLSNQGIREGDNLSFALNALVGADQGPIYFDEYHHGYRENVLWGVVPLPVKLCLAQVLVGLLLVALARSVRLGPIVPLERGGRQRSEFLGTMTAVLQRGQATRLAVQTAYDSALTQLRAGLGTTPDDDQDTLTQAVGRFEPEAGKRLEAALSEARQALDGQERLSEARAAQLVRRLDEAIASARKL